MRIQLVLENSTGGKKCEIRTSAENSTAQCFMVNGEIGTSSKPKIQVNYRKKG